MEPKHDDITETAKATDPGVNNGGNSMTTQTLNPNPKPTALKINHNPNPNPPTSQPSPKQPMVQDSEISVNRVNFEVLAEETTGWDGRTRSKASVKARRASK
jgi:hypothetical protein